MEPESPDSRFIKSLERGLSVLQTVSQHGPLNSTEVARLSGLPYPTVVRILFTLHAENYLERHDRTKCYSVTALVQSLAHGFQGDNRLVEIARPHLSALTRSLEWPVLIATPLASQMVVRDSTHAATSLTLHHYYPGFAFPIIDSAAGRAWLAFCSPEKRRQCIAGMVSGIDESLGHAIELAKDDAEFQKIREAGLATRERNTFTSPSGKNSSIAAPVFLGDEPCGALALVYFASTFSRDEAVLRFGEAIKATAKAITRQISEL